MQRKARISSSGLSKKISKTNCGVSHETLMHNKSLVLFVHLMECFGMKHLTAYHTFDNYNILHFSQIHGADTKTILVHRVMDKVNKIIF